MKSLVCYVTKFRFRPEKKKWCAVGVFKQGVTLTIGLIFQTTHNANH